MHAAHLEEESCGARRRRELRRRRRNTPDSGYSPRFSPRPLLPLLPPLQVHSMHTRADWELVRKEMRSSPTPTSTNGALGTRLGRPRPPPPPPPPPHLPRSSLPPSRRRLPFDVDGLKDLCARNPNIPKVYSKCAQTARTWSAESYSPAEERRRLTRRHLSHRPPPPATGASTPGAPSAARAQPERLTHPHTAHSPSQRKLAPLPRPAPLLTPPLPPPPPPLPRPQISRRRPRQDRYPSTASASRALTPP